MNSVKNPAGLLGSFMKPKIGTKINRIQLIVCTNALTYTITLFAFMANENYLIEPMPPNKNIVRLSFCR